MTTLRSLSDRLTQYETHEAQSIVRLMLYDGFSLSFTDICCGALDRLSPNQQQQLDRMMQRLQNGEPVQYVTGKSEFCSRTFHVEPGVLIPRPETEELCQWIKESISGKADILDIGTGSGCIAITAALDNSEANITAWDVSDDALRIATANAESLNATVRFVKQDALNTPEDRNLWDAIVSNPPYICNSEACSMEENVLCHEPHLALFVPDEEPLLFYRSIATYASHALKPQGLLFFEINPLYVNEMQIMLSALGFTDIETREDTFGKQRMMKARR